MSQTKIKEIMKFDVGADGFLNMIYVLAASALLVLALGGVFLTLLIREVRQIS